MEKIKTTLKRIFVRLQNLTILTVKEFFKPYYSGCAAEVAFFLLLSLVPSMILFAQILDLFTLSMDAIEALVEEYLNAEVVAVVTPLLSYSSSNAISIALVVLALWAGSKALFSLMRISNYAYSEGHRDIGPLIGYIKERIRAIATIALLLFTLVFAISIMVFGKVIAGVIESYLNNFLNNNFEINNIWYKVRWIVGFILYFFMISSIYYMLPNKRTSYKQLITSDKWLTVKKVVGHWISNSKATYKMIFPGSIFASVGMLIATWVYAMWMSHVASSNFNILYGSLSSIALLLLWFYILGFVLIIGIQINAVWPDSRDDVYKKDKYSE